MIDPSAKLPVVRQCALLDLSRSTAYYTPQPVSESDLALMLRDFLRQEGFNVGRRHISTLMGKMGIEALYRHPNTSRKHPQNPVFPYLLRGLTIDRANQVWAMDMTYIPMRKGFVYLAAVAGLGDSEGAVLAPVQQPDHGLLPRRRRGGFPPLWLAGNFQYGSG